MARASRNRDRRQTVALSCTVCGARNYKTTKSLSTQGHLELKKFCRDCNAHTKHIDSK